MSEGPTASYGATAATGKITAPVDTQPTQGFDVDVAMDRGRAAHDGARAVERTAALVIAATGVRIPTASDTAEGFLVNPIEVARALSRLGLLCVPPGEPVTKIAAQLADVATRRGNAIMDALAKIVTQPPTVDTLTEVYDVLSAPPVGRVLPDATVALMTTPPADDKAHIRNRLDLVHAKWVRVDAEGVDPADCLSYAFITHTDGVTYTAMRKGDDGVVLVFTPAEWDAFVKGAADGEFKPPTS